MARLKTIHYSNIKQKQILEEQEHVALSPLESLIHTLDVMDFMAAMRQEKKEYYTSDQKIEWILLKMATEE